MSFNLSGKTFLVTGAGRGIGRVLCKTLSDQGCKVYAVSRSEEPLLSLVSESSNIHPIQADVGNWEELRDKLKDIEPLDGLVNNAGLVEWTGPALNVSKDFLNNMINVQLLGPINALQVIGKKMVEAKKAGSIVNVSSVGGLKSFANSAGYCITKASLDMVTKQFALELAPHNIRVNSVNPTIVLTDTIKDFISKGLLNKTPTGIPMKRYLEVEEVVSPILYLLSDCSSMVSGTINIVDGAEMSSFTTTE